ncbi:MAG TPA: hypothetical protein VGN63_05895 [Flavisolibacter sp.]|jgi:hypothetical protein|nr:hypothetical protein [Flavisolibacter sp.]
MTFPIDVTYLNRVYTYDVETTDGLRFICRRQPLEHSGEHDAPPEVIALEKGERATASKPGSYKVQLHTDLMAGIEEFLRSGE